MLFRRFAPAVMALMLLPLAAAAQNNQQLLKQVEDALKSQHTGAVHDLGKLLKAGGVKEMEQQADRFKKEGLNLYFVTVPTGSTNVDALAEKVYQDLNGAPTDILVVFDGKRVYGKTGALKGKPQAFKDALQEAKPGFKQYYAKGLVMFAEALRKRIKGQKADAGSDNIANNGAPSASAYDDGTVDRSGSFKLFSGTALAGAVGVLVVGGGALAFAVTRKHRTGMADYHGTLRSAEALYNRITLDMPDPAPADLNAEWMRLDEKLQRARAHKAGLAEVVDLESDLKAFERRIEDLKRQQA